MENLPNGVFNDAPNNAAVDNRFDSSLSMKMKGDLMVTAVVALLIFLMIGILGSIVETRRARARRQEYLCNRTWRVLKKKRKRE